MVEVEVEVEEVSDLGQVTHDVTTPPDDVTSENKVMHFRCSASEARYHEIA